MAQHRRILRHGKKYPVLWLLHGTFGDYTDWWRKSSIERYATARDLIVVMPSGLNSNYLNWPGFGTGYRAWDYHFDELMPLVHNWYPASSKREDNYIAGLSMAAGACSVRGRQAGKICRGGGAFLRAQRSPQDPAGPQRHRRPSAFITSAPGT